jgi:ABC-type multidrug transport system fused ATPase/permease subunit
LIGIGIILLVYPIQQILGKHMHLCFAAKSKASDSKIKIVNEIIEGIRLIKLYSWEKAMASSIDASRVEE